MEFTKRGDNFIVRIDKGEEIVSKLTEFCKLKQISLGKISAIGAVNNVEIGVFDTVLKEYHSTKFSGTYEILSLLGNITSKNKKPYLHTHITLAGMDHKAFGGHLNRAVVSATCEIIISVIKGKLDRSFDEESQLNLLKIK